MKTKCRGCGQSLTIEDLGDQRSFWCWLCWPKAKEREINEFLQAEKERKEKKRR